MEKNGMSIFRNISLIFVVLMVLTFVTSMVAVSNVNAQVNPNNRPNRPTWAFVDAAPKTVGVGQPALISAGLFNPLNDNADGWNITVYITDPDGKVETFKRKTYATGSLGFYYAPTKAGNYTLYCTFDGVEYRNIWYAASESENATFTAVEGYWYPSHPGHQLPAEYWTRPIDAQLREWYTVAGSWVYKPKNLYAPFNEGPESAHILWSMPIGDTLGGLSGGANGPDSFQHGDGYEGKFLNSVTMCGVLYYNRYAAASPQQEIVAVDLHTGKILWERSYDFGGGRLNRGQILSWDFASSHGTWAYVWIVSGTNMWALDAATGDLKYNMTNVPSGTIYVGPNGEMLKYSAASYDNVIHLLQWNSTYTVNNQRNDHTAWGSVVQGRTFNAGQYGYDINVSTGITGAANSIGSLLFAFPDDRAIFGNHSVNGVTLTGISLNREENIGSPLFNRRTWDSPESWKDGSAGVTESQTGWAGFSQEDYVAVLWVKNVRVNYAFSLETGRFIYETEPQIYADAWGGVSSSRDVPEKIIAYNKLIEASVGGIVYCYDVKTGELLWTYEAVSKTTEYLQYAGNWWLIPVIAADGKAYFGHHEHSAATPLKRGAPFFALDIETGELVWEIEGAFRQTRWGGPAVIGDSIIATMDTYDQQIYAIGRGPSEMTVSVSNAVTTAGSTVLVSGTVMDVSPGTQSDSLRMRFPSGVPAVGDESMSDWMLYLYKQFEQPMSVTGIEITVYAWDGTEVTQIGNTTSDARGSFSIGWTPEKEGDYAIWAYFEGTAAYYGSDAKVDMKVLSAPEVPPPVETPPYEWYIVGAALSVIITVILVGMWIKKK